MDSLNMFELLKVSSLFVRQYPKEHFGAKVKNMKLFSYGHPSILNDILEWIYQPLWPYGAYGLPSGND